MHFYIYVHSDWTIPNDMFPCTSPSVWVKEKLLVMSNFSFSNCLFKRLILQTSKNQGLFEKRVKYVALVSGLFPVIYFFINLCTYSWCTFYQLCFHSELTPSSIFDHFVVLGFNATLTAKVISWRSVTHMCFLAFSHQYVLSKATYYFSQMLQQK